MINTGDPRHVVGHIVSGSLASAVIAGSINYNNYTKDEISKDEAIKNSLKLTVQGGVATGSAIAAANYLGKGNYLGVFAALSLGLGGVYVVEKVAEKLDESRPELVEEKTEEAGE